MKLGRRGGQLMVSDEIHTPDSSRYWFADSYAELFAAGSDQRKIDKELCPGMVRGPGLSRGGYPAGHAG